MLAYLCSWPALGQVTYVDNHRLTFTVLLEIRTDRAADLWEVSLWHSNGSEWHETSLPQVEEKAVLSLAVGATYSKAASSLRRLYFSRTVSIEAAKSFTIKFRSHTDQLWRWAREHQHWDDGHVIVKTVIPSSVISAHLDSYIEKLNPDLAVRYHHTDIPGAALWEVQSPVRAANKTSICKEVRFGIPWGKGSCHRWFALVQPWITWLEPRQGYSHFNIDRPAIMSSFLNAEGKHLVLLAISGVNDVKTTLTSDTAGNVLMQIKNDHPKDTVGIVLVAVGDSFESANSTAMYHARSLVSSSVAAGQFDHDLTSAQGNEQSLKLWAENWYDGLTYCTWNGLGDNLTEERVVNAVEELALNNINITNLIIDDNWQSINRGSRSWKEFEADPIAFPNGLKHAISSIRQKQPSIHHVAVWHALWGYWNGIDPDGKIAKTYKTVSIESEGQQKTVVAMENVGKFYEDFYQFLSSCGVDGVKTDAQCYLDTIEDAKNRRDLIIPYLDAWTVASLRHFSLKVISCMSLTPQHIFHSQLPQNRPPFLLRNSDDFYPDRTDSHTWHVWVNAHTALLTQHLNALPDWDMFQTIHDYSGFHAAARCVSGGPICITDAPGQHDIGLINQITGITSNGKTVIFRTSTLGKVLDPYNRYDHGGLLLVGAYHGQATTGTSMIGVFNTSSHPTTELVHLSKFPGVVEAQYYIVRAHMSGSVSKPLQIGDSQALLAITLDIRGYDILSAYPLREFESQSSNETLQKSFSDGQTTRVAVLGLIGKMAAAATVENITMQMDAKGRIVINTKLKALGILGLYISTLPSLGWQEHMLITILGQVVPLHTVNISEADAHVLEVDIETAWKELGLESRWSNEVEVKAYINSSKMPVGEGRLE